SMLEPKEEPLDDFPLMPSDNENSIPRKGMKEPKEEPLKLFHTHSDQYESDNIIIKEEDGDIEVSERFDLNAFGFPNEIYRFTPSLDGMSTVQPKSSDDLKRTRSSRVVSRPRKDADYFMEDSDAYEQTTGHGKRQRTRRSQVLSSTVAEFPPLPILSGSVKMCYLCGSVMDHYHATPLNPEERAPFLARVITSKKSELLSVRALTRNTWTANFCVHHLRVSDQIPKQKQIRTIPRAKTGKPKKIKKESKAADLSLASMDKPKKIKKKSKGPYVKLPGDPLTTFDAEEFNGVKCTLCARYTHNYAAVPSNRALRKDLLRRVIHVTREEKAIVEKLMCSRSRAFFCAEHIQEEYANVASLEINGVEGWETKEKSAGGEENGI
ncbi:hypothetical protein PMAYCL1PPCAC_08382, partial [Pristionchus mayeri]